MALCNSGAMSLGGSTTGRSVNCELGCSGTAQIDMNRTDVRDLAGRSSGSICMSNFYGKSSFDPGSLGGVVSDGSGYYMGTINAAGSNYYIIMSPNATGCASCEWRTSRVCSNVGNEQCDGYGNTYNRLANSSHPAGNWTATRSINGFSDWYLPAKCELNQLYQNCACAPSGQGLPAFRYWSSTEHNYSSACAMGNSNGNFYVCSKNYCLFGVRAVRRVSF